MYQIITYPIVVQDSDSPLKLPTPTLVETGGFPKGYSPIDTAIAYLECKSLGTTTNNLSVFYYQNRNIFTEHRFYLHIAVNDVILVLSISEIKTLILNGNKELLHVMQKAAPLAFRWTISTVNGGHSVN